MNSHSSPPTVALVGLGHQGQKHLQSLMGLAARGVVQIAAVVDVVQKDFTTPFTFFVDYQEMLRVVKPDIVVIATPNFLHYEQVLAAIKAGAYVIKEKPLAFTYDEGLKLVGTARQAQKTIFTCQQRHYARVWRVAAEQVKKLGKILDFSYNLTLNDAAYSWYWDQEQGGGSWLNLGWHGLKMIEWLVGDIVGVNVKQKRRRLHSLRCSADHMALATITVKTGVTGHLFVSSAYPESEVLLLRTEKGSLRLTPQELTVLTTGAEPLIWQNSEPKQEWYSSQLLDALATRMSGQDSMDSDLRVLKNLYPEL